MIFIIYSKDHKKKHLNFGKNIKYMYCIKYMVSQPLFQFLSQSPSCFHLGKYHIIISSKVHDENLEYNKHICDLSYTPSISCLSYNIYATSICIIFLIFWRSWKWLIRSVTIRSPILVNKISLNKISLNKIFKFVKFLQKNSNKNCHSN